MTQPQWDMGNGLIVQSGAIAGSGPTATLGIHECEMRQFMGKMAVLPTGVDQYVRVPHEDSRYILMVAWGALEMATTLIDQRKPIVAGEERNLLLNIISDAHKALFALDARDRREGDEDE